MVEVGRLYQVTKVYSKECKNNPNAGKTITFKAVIDWVEDLGDVWRIGYTPTNSPNYICKFGNVKVKKSGSYRCINTYFEEVK